MKILVACEESQAVTKELRRLGHEAYSCDIIPCSGGHPEWHIKQDVLPLLNGNCDFFTCDGKPHAIASRWDMIIAFPPCTYLTNAGARHLYKGGVLNQERYEKGLEAKEFFLMFWNAPCERIAIENPTPSRVYELPEKTQVIQPWQFGHPFTKRTQLWLKGLELLQPTDIVEPERTWCPSGSYSGKHNDKHRGMFTTDRAKNRSKTFPGIAKAMAEQWAGDVNQKERSIKEMELKMNDYQLPEQILFNYEELKKELTEKVSMYETLVYTDAQIKEAKEDRANLNKLKKALVDERIRREKEYMEPFNDFKAKINEIVSIIDRPVAVIDRQVKDYEEKQKQDKMDEIKNFWNSCDVPEGLVFEKIFDSKWLNATVSMKSIHEAIDAAIDKFNQDMSTLANLPEFGFEAQQVYISTLDMNKAIAEGHRMSEIARAKAEREAAMRKIEEEQKAKAQAAEAEQIPGQVGFTDSQSFDAIAEDAKPARQWVKFQAYMTTADALALKDFFNSRQIEFKAV